jgi:tRNA (guanine-N7-)-methyltransferase
MSKIPKAFTETAKRRVFGRRLGRPMGESRQAALDHLLPALSIEAEKVKEDGRLAPLSLFSSPLHPPASGGKERSEREETVLEIGFGNGEHLKAMMEQRPDRNYIGAEPFINGMSAFLKSISDMPRDNIRVWMDDAVALVRSFTPESLSAIYILNPDPWPKKKHHKRRIVRLETLAEYHRVLKSGGDLIMATDVDDLAEWMVTETMNHGGFDWQAESKKDWQTMPENWFLKTRYAAKGENAGRRQSYLLFKRK